MNNRFRRGSGVYTCWQCNKRTRDTGDGADNGLCKHCYQMLEWVNFVTDGGDIEKVPDEFREEVRNERHQ